MATEQVRVWRPADEDRVLLMAGQTTHYAIEPRGEYVFGVVAGQPMRLRRGRERRLIQPGQLVALDSSHPHSGTAVDGRPWSARLMVVEVSDLADRCQAIERELANFARRQLDQRDIAFLLKVEALHCQLHRERDGKSLKLTVRAHVKEQDGLVFSGKFTPGNVPFNGAVHPGR